MEYIVISYLDPGSGSALIGTVIALAGAILYSAKSVIYRWVKGKDITKDNGSDDTIVIFSEGKNYWGTFRPVVNELIQRKIHFRYYSLDLFDPALAIESPYMHSRLFDKNSHSSFIKLSKIKASVMLATTPNIGNPGYPLKRLEGVSQLIHVFHAFADISAYHKGSLDNYDAVIMVGDHQIEPIRSVEKARGLNPKELISMGLPYIDDQYAILGDKKNPASAEKTVLVASSWGEKGCLREYGIDFIKDLAGSGFNVIIRPHPQSYITELKFINDCMAQTKECKNIRWDSSTIGGKAMQESDILVSDTSSIRFDYAFLYGKPVITLNIPRERQDAYESVYMERIWTDDAGERIGEVVDANNIDKLSAIISSVLSDNTVQNLEQYRDEVITNFGCSSESIVEFLIKKNTDVLEARGGNNA